VPFEVIAEGAPFVGKGRAPILLAIRGDDPKRVVPDGLPEQAREILHRIFGTPTPDLYIVVYVGLAGSTGFRVRINSITVRQDSGMERLAINYSVDKPLPSTPQSDVITHPFVIVRVRNTDLRASDVIFEGQ